MELEIKSVSQGTVLGFGSPLIQRREFLVWERCQHDLDLFEDCWCAFSSYGTKSRDIFAITLLIIIIANNYLTDIII